MDWHRQANLGLGLVRTTEAAALAAARWMGLADSDGADRAATAAMMQALSQVPLAGQIVVGDESRLGGEASLVSGETVGNAEGLPADVVPDPIDGRTLLALGYPGAISVIAAAPRGSMWRPAPAAYMAKIVVPAQVAAALVPQCLDAPAAWTLALVARARGKPVRDLVVFVLDRPRHRDLLNEIRAAGARVMLRSDGDIAGALMAASGVHEVDIMMGVGGIPEGLIAACAVKALGGAMLGRLAPQTKEELAAVRQAGLDTRQVLSHDQMVRGPVAFCVATGITDGPVLQGIHFEQGNHARTNSLILRAETRVRRVLFSEQTLPEAGVPPAAQDAPAR
ncbi:MAG: fructose-bisphosphatase class II family protein [Chloroflexota bacterium]